MKEGHVTMLSEPYKSAQHAICELKGAIHVLLATAPSEGLSNAEIGRLLGIYQGHIGHEGHIPRTLLEMMKSEGVVEQDSESKKWCLKRE